MMTLALYVLGVIIITFIARYNESNKLFWTLFTAYTLGYAGTTMVIRSLSKQSNDNCMQVSPTQDATLPSPTTTFMLVGDTIDAPKKETSDPVSQAPMLASNADVITTANVANSSRDQPVIHVLANPPTPYNTS